MASENEVYHYLSGVLRPASGCQSPSGPQACSCNPESVAGRSMPDQSPGAPLEVLAVNVENVVGSANRRLS